MWLLYVTLFSLTQLTELSWLHSSSGFLQKRNFLEHQKTEVSSRDIHVISFVYAKHLSLINLA